MAPTRAEAEEDEDKLPFVPARPGLNRFVWDLRYAEATKIATKGGDRSGRDGPRAAPGAYSVRLQVGDQTFTESFAISQDPRAAASQADLEAQFALGLKIRDKLNETNQAINAIRRAREPGRRLGGARQGRQRTARRSAPRPRR